MFIIAFPAFRPDPIASVKSPGFTASPIAKILGGKTFKLKFGHRGSNQPVKNLLTGRIEITSQNHGFAVDIDSLNEKNIKITHKNLNDNTLEGFRHRELPIFAVQYHPEASPGPHDSRYLFDEFKKMIKCNNLAF